MSARAAHAAAPVATSAPAERVERVLAVGRAFLTVTALAAIYLDPSEPARLREITYGVLLAYAVYSLAVLAAVQRATRLTPRHTYAFHGLDILWASALTFVSQGPVSPFFLFFLFVVLASAYRWGLRETVGTALVTIGVFLLETLVAGIGAGRLPVFAAVEFDLNTTILRVAYLLLTGVLLGYLAEQDKRTRAELAAAAAAARQPHIGLGLGGSVTSFARTLLEAFAATGVVIVIRDEDTRRTLRWRVDRAATGALQVQRDELDPISEALWLFPDGGRTWFADRPARAQAAVLVAEPGLWPLRAETWTLPDTLLGAARWDSVTAVNMQFEREWRARAYVFGPRDHQVPRRVHFLRALADQATPALTNAFLLRRLRARAGAAERARVARELHDGAIQSLFAIDMKLEALRRVADDPERVRVDVEEVQDLVRQEVTELRELMIALRPVEIDSSEQLPEVLASVVDRFRRESGMGARFVTTGARTNMAPARAVEVVKIAQEALVNARKHSGAGQVLLRLAASESSCQLVIEDDGRGCGFEGRLTLAELDDRRLGPAVIKERARLIGADLAVESSSGAGTRVELTIPGEVHA